MERPGEHAPIKSVRDPGPASLAETIDRLNDNIFESALFERDANKALAALPPGHVDEPAAKGWITVARIEKEHWSGYLRVYRRWLEAHPELADEPVGTKCKHIGACSLEIPIERDPGVDDEDVVFAGESLRRKDQGRTA